MPKIELRKKRESENSQSHRVVRKPKESLEQKEGGPTVRRGKIKLAKSNDFEGEAPSPETWYKEQRY